MNTGIEMSFFEPHDAKKKNYGKLYLDIAGKNYIEFRGNIVKQQFDPIRVAFATDAHSNEKYSLINCIFSHTDFKTFRYQINEIYIGAHLNKVTENGWVSAEARMTYLTSWVNRPRLISKVSSSVHEPGSVVLKEEFSVTFPVNENSSLEICEFCAESFKRREVHLRSIGYIKFFTKKTIPRLELYHNIIGFLKLLSIFTDTTPRLSKLEFTNEDQSIIELVLPEKVRNAKDESDSLLDYPKMEVLLPTIIKKFYSERNKFVKVLDLLIESLENKTAEVSFLNATTAFEVYHKNFFEKDV